MSNTVIVPGAKHRLIAGHQRKINGWRKQPPDHRDIMLSVSAPVVLAPAASNRKICSPTENQESIGSCTANSSTSAMEALYKKLGRPVVNLSRLFVYYYSRKVEGTPPTEDSGCVIRDVMKCLAHFGAPPEELWPYDVQKFSIGPSYQAIKAATQHKITAYYRCPTLSAIKRSIAEGFTCVGGFSVPANMMSAECEKTGIIKFPSAKEGFEGGHAVHFIGYDDKTQLLEFQNSWGGWGDHGFGYLPYKFVEEGLADDFWSIREES